MTRDMLIGEFCFTKSISLSLIVTLKAFSFRIFILHKQYLIFCFIKGRSVSAEEVEKSWKLNMKDTH